MGVRASDRTSHKKKNQVYNQNKEEKNRKKKTVLQKSVLKKLIFLIWAPRPRDHVTSDRASNTSENVHV